jgi:formylglycine-generating enzyme required for sulfatase activity
VTYIPAQTASLTEGSNQLIVRVTAEDGTTTRDYTLMIYRMGSDYTSTNIAPLVYVPAGYFQRSMGETNISYVSAFRMSRIEITRSQFSNVMLADPSDPTISQGTSDPVQYINWYQAIAFCNKLSIREGLTPVYTVAGVNFTNLSFASIPIVESTTWDQVEANWSVDGYRLPTDMEFMWAAMGANMAGSPLLSILLVCISLSRDTWTPRP